MTDYGRNSGSQPWHPEDPLYGDQVWGDGQPPTTQEGWDPYATGQHQRVEPSPYAQQYPGPQQHQQHQQQHQHQQPGYAEGGWDTQGGGVAHGYGQGQGHGAGPGPGMTDPYGRPAAPYGPGQGQPGYPDPYAAEPAYQQQPPYPEDPRHGAGGGHPRPGPDPDTGWDPGPDLGEHSFFTDGDEEREADPVSRVEERGQPETRAARRGARNRRGGAKRRSGGACLVVVLVLGGGLTAVGYLGYQFYESHFAAAPDYSGEGHGEIDIEIPEGATHSDMGNILKKAGVVKSHDAFVAAAGSNAKALGIHAGAYTLRREMSADAAVALMLDPASQNGLIIPEGRRATQIYALVDKKLGEKKGTTEKVAKSADLGLPSWAEGDVEGFLFPAKYTVSEQTQPEALLRTMVKRATTEYRKMDLESQARKVGMTPREVIIIASLVQAEAQEDSEFGKVSRVVYNRLEEDMTLGFDSTINYAKGRSTLDVSIEDTNYDSPYNTYRHRGLPPGPIDNPGHQALEAALNPTQGAWLYFVTVKPGDTRFSETHAEHERHVQDFNAEQRKKREREE